MSATITTPRLQWSNESADISRDLWAGHLPGSRGISLFVIQPIHGSHSLNGAFIPDVRENSANPTLFETLDQAKAAAEQYLDQWLTRNASLFTAAPSVPEISLPTDEQLAEFMDCYDPSDNWQSDLRKLFAQAYQPVLNEAIAKVRRLETFRDQSIELEAARRTELAALNKQLEAAHQILDNDPSQIVRDYKDSYPEGHPPQLLTLPERVQALARYAADYKEWHEQKEKMFDLIYDANMRGAELWREAHPGKELTIPDQAQMIFWLLERLGVGELAERQTGVMRIAAERDRQIEVEGWGPEHDDEHNDNMQLGQAAACYLLCYMMGDTATQAEKNEVPRRWPWHPAWWKPKDDIAMLTKAGALIAAELDRLSRS